MSKDNLISQNTFLGGMNQDTLSSLSDNKSYYFSRNAIHSTHEAKNFGLTNEGSNAMVAATGSDVVGTAYVEDRNWTVVFKANDSLWYYDHTTKEYKEIMSAGEFGCTWGFNTCEWIGNNAEFKSMHPCNDLYVYFSSNCEYYRVNIDQMLDPDRKAGLKKELACDTKCGYRDNCEYFKIFKQGCAPKITPKVFDNGGGGGNLKAGAYTFVARLIHTDGGETNWFHFSEPAFVGSEHNIAGEDTSSFIEVSLSCLDCKFAAIELAVIENIGGIITAKTLNTFNYNSQQFTYRYNGLDGEPIDIKELLTKENIYLRGRHLAQKDGHLLYYGIRSRKNLNYQKYANKIKTEYVVYEIPYDQVKKYNIRGLMRGETYAFAIVWNFIDGTHSVAFHIPAQASSGGGGGGEDALTSSTETQDGQTQPNVPTPSSQGQRVERTRTPLETDSVSNPQNDHYDDIMKDIVDSMETTGDDVCQEIDCEGCSGASSTRCDEDLPDVEESGGNFEDLVDSYLNDDLSPDYDSDKIHEGAKKIAQSIKDRERKTRKKRTYDINKDQVTYDTGSGEEIDDGSGGDGTNFSGSLFDCCGINETEVDIRIVSSGETEVDEEENILYSCATDCEGEFIYDDLAGEKVRHHKFPDASEEPHYISKSVGVPYGTFFPDASETDDLYIRIMGPRFSNIQTPEDSELTLPLCPHNPYSIVMVKRTDSNKKVILKGLATGTFVIDNNGKKYEQQRYGVNSLETVSFYHDDGEGNRLSELGDGDSHVLYSLDGLTIRPAIHAEKVVEEMRLRGQGERYGLYSKGKDPENSLNGSRIDALGARQSINLSEWSKTGVEEDLIFKKYVKGDETASHGNGGSRGLMNKSQQECIWFLSSGLPQITDESFTGDVLDHNVIINFAEGQYVSFRRDLLNQYGALEGLNYIPLLHAGKNHEDSIQGPVGDTYIGPFSFVKTGFVSDKVGECTEDGKFNIPEMVDTKTEKRCICDGPEDSIQAQNGAWTWTELPEEGDAADPKNWAGTHTNKDSETFSYEESAGQAPISDYYYPGVTTTNITYIGEFETCPWLREKSDFLEKQWYPEIKKPDFRFDSGVSVDGNTTGWRDSFLNQFHREIEQPSLWKRVVKTIIRTSLNVLFPMLGIDNAFDISGGSDFLGNLAEFPMLLVLWYLMVQVLFRNDTIDKLLGIPICKSDEVGGFKEGFNRGLFFNFSGYNVDYSTLSDIYRYQPMPDPYFVCDCDDCFGINAETTSEIYISDRQKLGSIFDAYVHVRPRSKIHISSSYGTLTNLFVAGGDLFAHTTDAIIPIPRNRAMVASSRGDIFLGEQGFLLEPEGVITEGIVEGYSGLKHHNSHIDSQYGYFFVDEEADVIYQFQPQTAGNAFPARGSMQTISMKGMFNFLKEHLPFCNKTDCHDERTSGGSYYALGVDPRFNRLLVTKSDGSNSFTLSYDLERGVWISFHDYVPRSYIWDRKDMYSLDSSGIWKHNEDCHFQTYYGQYYPHEIQVTAISQEVDTFVWESFLMNTEAEVCVDGAWIEDIDRTFNKIAFWNSTQGTGTMDVRWVSDDKGMEDARERIKQITELRANKMRRMWRINEIKDHRKRDCLELPMLIKSKCEPLPKVNEGIFDCTVLGQQNYRGRVIADKYCVYRLTYDHDATTKINTIYLNTYGKSSER